MTSYIKYTTIDYPNAREYWNYYANYTTSSEDIAYTRFKDINQSIEESIKANLADLVTVNNEKKFKHWLLFNDIHLQETESDPVINIDLERLTNDIIPKAKIIVIANNNIAFELSNNVITVSARYYYKHNRNILIINIAKNNKTVLYTGQMLSFNQHVHDHFIRQTLASIRLIE